MKKLFAWWIPCPLTINQKQQRVDDSERALALFQRNQTEFSCRFVTIDEIWIHYYTPEPNRQSAECLQANESRLKPDLKQVTLLNKLDEEIKKKQQDMNMKKTLFHDENAPVHSSIKALVKLDFLGYELLPHSPYSPYLALIDDYLFPNWKAQRKKISHQWGGHIGNGDLVCRDWQIILF